jgi:ParE toxin of type II toxin-antitoxin system, parDE
MLTLRRPRDQDIRSGRDHVHRLYAGGPREIRDYIGQANPTRARSYLQELRDHCRRIAARPRLYRLREEFGPGARAAAYGATLHGSG